MPFVRALTFYLIRCGQDRGLNGESIRRNTVSKSREHPFSGLTGCRHEPGYELSYKTNLYSLPIPLIYKVLHSPPITLTTPTSRHSTCTSLAMPNYSPSDDEKTALQVSPNVQQLDVSYRTLLTINPVQEAGRRMANFGT
jgi:hypothetical protein